MKNKKAPIDDEISKAFSDSGKLTKILYNGIPAALLKHKQAGNPICESRNNKIVWIPAEKITINFKE